MQFLFVLTFIEFRYIVRIVNKATRTNNRVQIFQNNFFNNFLRDFNFFIFSTSKRVFKRFLNNITINTNNKSTKKFKKIKRSLKKKLRVESYIIFYFFIFFFVCLCCYTIATKKIVFIFFLFTFTFFSFRLIYLIVVRSIFSIFKSKKKL